MRKHSECVEEAFSSLRYSIVWPVVFCAAALMACYLTYDRAFSSYDDGVTAQGALMVLRGYVPYKDFWTIYPPGSYYVNALMLWLLGEELLVIRLANLILVPVQAAFLWGILSRTAAGPGVIALAGLGFAAFIPIGLNVTTPITYWFAFCAAAAYCLVRWIEKPSGLWAIICGAALGLSLLMRQDGGLYSAAVALLVIWAVAPKLGARRWRHIGLVLTGMAVTAGTMVCYLAARGALIDMLRDSLYFTVVKFPNSRRMPYPVPWEPQQLISKYYAPLWIGFVYKAVTYYLWPAALALLAMISTKRLLGRCTDRAVLAYCALALMAAALFTMVLVRSQAMRTSGAVALGLVAMAGFWNDEHRLARIAARVTMAAAVAAFICFGVVTVLAQRNYSSSPMIVRGGIYAGRGYADMISYVSVQVRKRTRPDERILSGSPTIYFTSDRLPATRYYEPHPCFTDTTNVQRDIIRDMERNNVRLFVRSSEWTRDGFFTIERKNQPRILIGYIRRHFRMILDCGVFQIYERKKT